nr:hypothetical protein [Bacteroidales bacterium]
MRNSVTGGILSALFVLLTTSSGHAQNERLSFGKSVSLDKAIFSTKEKEQPLIWINVNTDRDTWHVEKDILVCSGKPI